MKQGRAALTLLTDNVSNIVKKAKAKEEVWRWSPCYCKWSWWTSTTFKMICAQTFSCMSNCGKLRRERREGRQATMLCGSWCIRTLWSTCWIFIETFHTNLKKPVLLNTNPIFWHHGPHRLHGEVVQPGRGQIGWSWGEVAWCRF